MWNGHITGKIVVPKIHLHIFKVKLQMFSDYIYLEKDFNDTYFLYNIFLIPDSLHLS